jgi:hypothetical protein
LLLNDDEFIVKIVSVAHDCCVRERGVSKSSLSQLCVKSAREWKAKEWRISREESKKYSKGGLSLGTRTTRTTHENNRPPRDTRELLLNDDDKENYDEIFFCYEHRERVVFQKRKDFKAKSVRASFAALWARLSGCVRALDPSL